MKTIQAIILSFLFLLFFPYQASCSSPANITLEDIKTSYKKRSYQRTIALSQNYLKRFPKDVDVLFYEGLAYKQMQQCEKAVLIFERALLIYPNYQDVRVAYVGCLFSLQRNSQALEVIEQGLQHNPKHAELLYLKAKALLLLNEKQKAINLLKSMTEKKTVYPPAKLLLNNLKKEASETYLESLNAPQESRTSQIRIRNLQLADERASRPKFITGIFSDIMEVNVPNQSWNLSNLYTYWLTSRGALGGSANYANRYGLKAVQGEINAIPKLNKHLYLDLAYAYANKPELFPNQLERAELYAYLGKSLEASFGGAHRKIAHFILDSMTGSVGKYFGRYYFNFRPIYFRPGSGPRSILYKGGIRRYGDNPEQYIGIVFFDGHSPDLTDLLTVDFIKVRNRGYFVEGLQPINQAIGFQYGVGYEELRYPNQLVRRLVHVNLGLKIGWG